MWLSWVTCDDVAPITGRGVGDLVLGPRPGLIRQRCTDVKTTAPKLDQLVKGMRPPRGKPMFLCGVQPWCPMFRRSSATYLGDV